MTALRFVAAFAVVLNHAGWIATRSQAANEIFGLGYVGVSFFFVLSGFVLTWSLSPTRSTTRFYWLRFARVWPLHAITTAVVGLYFAGQFWIPRATGIAAVVSLTQGFSTSEHTYFGLNGVSWSLSCEVLFYLLFPLVVRPLLRQRLRTLALVATADVLLMLAVPLTTYSVVGHDSWAGRHAEWLFFINPAFRFTEFLLGVTLGCSYRAGWRARMGLGGATAGLVGTAAVICWLQVRHGVQTPRPYAAALLAPWFALVIAAAARDDIQGRPSLLRQPALVFLGHTSFALYLTHQIVERSARWEAVGSSRSHSGWVAFGAFFLTALAVAAFTHMLIERPAERWLRMRGVGRRDEMVVEDPGLAKQLTSPVVGADAPHAVRSRS